LCSFHRGLYDLGAYQHIQLVIDRFRETDSFCRANASAQPGFATIAILDPTFAPPEMCAANETPLACEIRRGQPSYAFIYLGIGDITYLSATQFREQLMSVVRGLSSNGVIPILATTPLDPTHYREGLPELFSQAIRDVGHAENVPILDIWAAVWHYNNHGLNPDGYHLASPMDGMISFNGNQDIFGRTRYEFLAMQLLYRMITEINI
jgi:hypothetical protein